MIELIYAHPYPRRSRANQALLQSVEDLPFVVVRPLYELYPDFAIDIESEQQLLSSAHTVVWQHPLYWYSVPPLLKLWFDKVLTHGWAYGDAGIALHGKVCQWVITTGGTTSTYEPSGMHRYAFQNFVPPIEQTARFCGMSWQTPITVHGAHRISDKALGEAGSRYRERLVMLQAQHG
jgi:glutathione-regulated potassium-efflux system ancillary protein KefF